MLPVNIDQHKNSVREILRDSYRFMFVILPFLTRTFTCFWKIKYVCLCRAAGGGKYVLVSLAMDIIQSHDSIMFLYR